jgi:ABC-type glucose/galactose transport system permease subunit
MNMKVEANKWTGYTIVAAVIGAIALNALEYGLIWIGLLHHPLPIMWGSIIGAIIGVAIVQVIHKKKDPFTAY